MHFIFVAKNNQIKSFITEMFLKEKIIFSLKKVIFSRVDKYENLYDYHFLQQSNDLII